MAGVVQNQPDLAALQGHLLGVAEQLGLIHNNPALFGLQQVVAIMENRFNAVDAK
jgi:hypothetical protein